MEKTGDLIVQNHYSTKNTTMNKLVDVLFAILLHNIIYYKHYCVYGQNGGGSDCFGDDELKCESRIGVDGRYVHLRDADSIVCLELCAISDEIFDLRLRNWDCGKCTNGPFRQVRKCDEVLSCRDLSGIDGYWIRKRSALRNRCTEMCENFKFLDVKLGSDVWECGRCS